VIHPIEGAEAATTVSSSAAQAPHEDGWYLYGITRPTPSETVPAASGAPEHHLVDAGLDVGPDRERVHVLVIGSLAAVVRRVPLADFTAEALQARLAEPGRLEAMVQAHNAVIHAVHQQRAILPVRLGAVYARLEDIAAAVEARDQALAAQLAGLDGCDEWAVHVCADRRIVQAHALAQQAPDWERQLASAGPGRAYLLRRRLADGLAAKTAEIADEIALAAYRQLARLAVDARAERPASPSDGADGETEVLRAAFLVRRERSEEFVGTVRTSGEDGRGWHCTYSGPWPPYSFAAAPEGDGDDRQDA
jgi:hypothetical protein